MRDYELTYLIAPELSEEEAKSLQDKVVSLMRELEGVSAGEGLPLRRRLAYPIKKKNEAYLGFVSFQMSAEKLLEFEKKLKLEDQILRFLISIKAKPAKVRVILRKPLLSAMPTEKEKKVELKEIEEKLEEILKTE
jgi:small subunit ribosomal protein S6